MSKLRDVFTSLWFPGYCPVCYTAWNGGQGWMCDSCWNGLPLAESNPWRGDSVLAGRCIAIFQYGDLARHLVHQMKFYGREDIAERLGLESVRHLVEWMDVAKFAAVTPVPLHPARIRERGYDQNFIIAQVVAERLNLPLRSDIIARTRHRPPQSRLSDAKRRRNLIDAFAPNPKPKILPHGIILLVDDVIHTGATVKGCIEALHQAGANSVFVLAACG